MAGAGDGMTGADLTTIVLTRRREPLLARALRSLARQRGVQLAVMVVVDDCPPTWRYVQRYEPTLGAVRSVRHIYAERGRAERSGPGRVARLRDAALGLVQTEWVAFLDDDNVVEPEHYVSLLQRAAESAAPAVHSWRSLWDPTGQPFLLSGRHPWCHDSDLAETLFVQYEAAGIYQRDSHVVRDQVVPHDRARSMVDTSEWLFRADFLGALELCQEYTLEDWRQARTEDSKLLDQIVESGLPIPSTQRATLRYSLGGYSNNPLAEAASMTGWVSG
jgi:hypothetical protein